ncbi:MAG: type II toxin-antitoxin system VapC family toxin [Bryobacterales bacterium]|nr:type II toxin-antitoxin system VapC family toxin [Bryobacterales bacterium]
MATRIRHTSRRAAAVREAYLDTSAFIAFLDRSDSYHSIFRIAFATPPSLVTSALVIAEAHGWFLRRYDTRRATGFLGFLDALPEITVVPFDGAELAKQRPVLSRFDDQNLTLADAHGLVIMAERKIRSCWSTDRHLALMGAELIVST